MTRPEPNTGTLTWVFRGVLALAALAAPILVFKGFTDADTADPLKQHRLREAAPPPAHSATIDPSAKLNP